MLCLSILHTTQRLGDACRQLPVHGLCEGGTTFADYHGYRDGIRAALAFPILRYIDGICSAVEHRRMWRVVPSPALAFGFSNQS